MGEKWTQIRPGVVVLWLLWWSWMSKQPCGCVFVLTVKRTNMKKIHIIIRQEYQWMCVCVKTCNLFVDEIWNNNRFFKEINIHPERGREGQRGRENVVCVNESILTNHIKTAVLYTVIFFFPFTIKYERCERMWSVCLCVFDKIYIQVHVRVIWSVFHICPLVNEQKCVIIYSEIMAFWRLLSHSPMGLNNEHHFWK